MLLKDVPIVNPGGGVVASVMFIKPKDVADNYFRSVCLCVCLKQSAGCIRSAAAGGDLFVCSLLGLMGLQGFSLMAPLMLLTLEMIIFP